MNYHSLYRYIQWHIVRDLKTNILQRWNQDKIINFLVKIFSFLKFETYNTETYFNFNVNSALAGEPVYCSSLSCRLQRADNLSRFSALYADKIVLQFPLNKYFGIHRDITNIDRVNLYNDIIVLLKYKPLALEGIIEFHLNSLCLCDDCLKKHIKDKEAFDEKLQLVAEIMYEELILSLECYVSIIKNTSTLSFELIGLEKYGYHSISYIRMYNDNSERYNYSLSLLNNKEKVKLSKADIKKIELHKYILSSSFDDIVFNNYISSENSLSYLTDKDVDIDIINLLHPKSQLDQSNNLFNSLTHYLTILPDVSVSKIVDLRKKEGEAFAVYRDNINKILKENPNLSNKEYQELNRDIILPNINKINRNIRNNKKLLVDTLTADLLFWGSTISIGIFSNLLPLNLAAIAGAMGGISTIKNLGENILKLGQTEHIARENDYYFLWKLNQKANNT